jgi:hypothetical protein
MTNTKRHPASQLLSIRLPTRREAKSGAEIVFHRLREGREEVIYAAVCYEGWQQWGASREVLSANVQTAEHWRRGEIPGFRPQEDEILLG